MVLTISSRPARNGVDPRFDGGRIAAGAGAIALHVVLLMLVLVPMELPSLTPEPVRLPDVQWVQREQPKPIERVPIEKAVPAPVPQPAPVLEQPAPVTPFVPVVEVQAGDIAVAPSEPVANTPAESIGPVPVMTGAALRYAAAPPPPYPAKAVRAGLEGTVLLEVLVDTDGRPLEVTIARGSGHRELDRAALRHVQEHWRFQPALRDGRPVQAIGLVPIGFSLRR